MLSTPLPYTPPLAWSELMRFLGKRRLAGMMMVDETHYRRTVRLGECSGYFEVSMQGETLTLAMTDSLKTVQAEITTKVGELFDLNADTPKIEAHLSQAGFSIHHQGLRLPGAFDAFEMVVRAILGQQITVAAATTIAGRVTTTFGEPIATPHAALTHIFPSAACLAALTVSDLAQLGIIARRSECIIRLADELASGRLDLTPKPYTETEVNNKIKQLTALPGIGDWTAHYIAMRALKWPDAFPAADLGIMKALGVDRPKAAIAKAEALRPFRAYAVMHLWNRL